MSKYKKIISVILMIVMVITYCPMEVFAEQLSEINPKFEENINKKRDIEPEIVGEIKEERAENQKIFLKSDNSYEAAIYPDAVHYREGNQWKDIDNSLSNKFDNEEKQNFLENKSNSYKVKIAKNTNSNKLVKVKKDKYELAWSINKSANVAAKTKAKDKSYMRSLPEEEQDKVLPNISSSVEFKDVYENVDLKYDIISDDVKENIILKEKTDNQIFRFNLKLKNLIPKVLEDRSIVFYDKEDTNKAIFSMDAPFMYDASGAVSKNVQVNVKENKKGYILELQPNIDWLNDEKRVYPITIDPSVSTPLDKNKILDNHVSQNYAPTNYRDSVMLKTGKGASSGINRTYISFELPELKTGDLITSANLDLSLYSANSSENQVNVHKVKSAWDSSKITWNNKPEYNPKIEDYKLVKGSTGQYMSWDITSIVKDWYSSGNNYGLMLKNNDETKGYNEYYSSDTSTTYGDYRPQVTINYTNNSGLEDYWTYHSQDIGRAGTGYINDYNGNFVLIHDDLSMNGNRMPVSLDHVFNSNDRTTEIGYGLGWRLNLSQKIVSQTIGGVQYYVYTDEDGTKHYLKCTEGNTYKDESGLDLTLTVTPSVYEKFKLKDKGGNQLTFSEYGTLLYIEDNNGNKITLSYIEGKLKKITDGAGRVTNLNVDGNGKLTSIVDPSNKKTSFEYDISNRLIKITYPDGKYTSYSYDGRNNLTSATNFDGYKISYTYYNVNPYRVQKAQESHTNGTLGEEINISYGYNATSFTDYKGRKSIYQFNNEGNTINIKDNDGSAQYYKYFENGGNKNKLNSQSKLQKTTLNYLNNHNIEQGGYWSEFNWGNSTGNASFTTENKYIGNKSLKVEKTNALGDQGYYQSVPLEKGKTYTLSGYIKANNISTGNKKGAALIVTYQKLDGSWNSVYSDYVNGTKDWDRYEVTFTLPSDAMSNTISVKAGIDRETGTAYFDNLQLEDGAVANRYNLVENADFKYGTGTPDFWMKNDDCNTSDLMTTVSGQPSSLDNKVFKLNGEANKKKNIVQTINVSGKKGDSIVLGGWAKGDSVASASTTARYYAVDIGIQRLDGTYQWVKVDFNEDSNDWQYTSGVAIADSDYKSIKLYALYYNNANSAYFDGLQLYKEEFDESYQYDANGNVISTKDLDKQNSKFAYNTNNDLIKSTDPKGNNFNYTYDSKHNLLNATSSENVVYSFTYDSYGNPLTSKVGDSNLFINSSSTYTENGNYIKSLKDSQGNVVTYNYNETNGNLNSLVDANGKATSYTYDNIDRLQSTSKVADGATITNSYSYENDKLKTINHNGFNYSFGYDSLGNDTTVSVGNQNLITNIYEARSGKLLEAKYGNNQKVSSVYDNEDRVISEKYTDSSNNTQERHRYEYDASGNVGYHEDLVNKIGYRYIYDLSDRLVKIKESNGNEILYNYDANNNHNKVTEKVSNNTYVTSYGYDKDDRLTNVTTPKGKSKSYKYDSIGRLLNNAINTGTATLNTNFSYVSGLNGSTTNKVESIDNGGSKISYTYNKNGNIETITENSKTIKYYYNELEELKKEEIRNNQGVLEKTINYSYDSGGNILKKEEYIGTSTTPTNTVNYGYGDSNWKDKLTSFNGKEITYDAIGNPLTYNGFKFSWEEGKQLSKLAGNGLDISYKYDSDGIRTEKTVNGVTTKYHVVDENVTFESNGTDNIYYTYDTNDSLVSIELNGVEYYYVRNAQGDIIGLIDSNGNKVVSYTYDTWGKLLSIEGSLKDSLGIKNPYRYRGYRYDNETQLYYLQSRYYNPEWGRFINADSLVGETGELLSHNMFAYCTNDPVNNEDPDGDIAWWVGAAVGGAAFDSAIYLIQHRRGGATWKGLGKAAAGGAISGVLFGGAGKIIKGVRSAKAAKKITSMCFTGDTLVSTKDGDKPIKDIKVGDEVYSENPETGEKGLKKVKRVFVNESDKLVHVYVNGEKIKATPEHPFWVVNEGWVKAEDLELGDEVLLYSGEVANVEKVEKEELDKAVKVYNFEVEDWHTYFVSGEDVLVHNTCMAGGRFANVDKGKRLNEVGHHIPQNAYNKKIGISRSDGPSVLMSKADHAKTRTFAGRGKQAMKVDKGLSARQRLAKDIKDVRNHFGSKYNKGLRQAIKYAKTLPQYKK